MKKVLVVDDEKLIVKGIRFSLEQDGYEVDCAYDGEEAIEMARKTEYDIVLLDVMLPKHDGFEVCQTIREFSSSLLPILERQVRKKKARHVFIRINFFHYISCPVWKTPWKKSKRRKSG